jgi:hypothetical protein
MASVTMKLKNSSKRVSSVISFLSFIPAFLDILTPCDVEWFEFESVGVEFHPLWLRYGQHHFAGVSNMVTAKIKD